MSGFEPEVSYVLGYVQLTEEEALYFTSLLKIRKVKKKQFIVQPDFVCKYRSYVISRAMRAYLLDDGPKSRNGIVNVSAINKTGKNL